MVLVLRLPVGLLLIAAFVDHSSMRARGGRACDA
jgi:hypothetical protein